MIDPAFGNWFAGFTDGEGSFAIPYTTTHDTCRKYRCSFSITQRADDKAILDEVQAQLGIGSVLGPYERHASLTEKHSQRRPQVIFQTRSKSDCIALRYVFHQFPLRAKKTRDFEIWSEALSFWVAHEPGAPWDGMAAAKVELEAVRKYG